MRARTRVLLAEFLGSALLCLVVVGSGIAAQQLSPNDVGLELLENTIATGAGLFVLITVFGPISGAHFNPVVSLVMARRTGASPSAAALEIPFQVAGCIAGAIVANVTFSLKAISFSTHHRASGPHLLAEVLATATLVTVIGLLVARDAPTPLIAGCVALTITAAYSVASSTSFANPAITVGRAFSNTFAGIAPASTGGFIAAQLVGGLLGLATLAIFSPPSERVNP